MDRLPLAPYREIGLVCDGPACVYAVARKMYVLAGTGRAHKVYALPSLKIKLLGPSLREPARFVHAWNEAAFRFDGEGARRFHFQHEAAARRLGDVTAVLGVGPEMFVLRGERTLTRLDAELRSTEELELPFAACAMVHPPGYRDKILFYAPRQAVLFNVRDRRIVFDFFADAGFATQLGAERIELVVAGGGDLAALGCASGLVAVVNLRSAAVLRSFTLNGAVRSLCFAEGAAGPESLFACNDEFFACFALAENALRLLPFKARYSLLQVLASEDQRLLLGVSAADNALHLYALEETPRLVRARQGARQPLRKIRFFGPRALIGSVEAERDALFRFSLHNDAASVPLSDKRKAPAEGLRLEGGRPADFALDRLCAENVQRQLFTRHEGSALPVAWDVRNARRAKFFLERSSAVRFHADAAHAPWVARTQPIAALALSPAAAFLFLGYADGSLVKVAAQSGEFQAAFRPPPTPGPPLALEVSAQSSCLWALTPTRLFALDFFSGEALFAAETPGALRGFFDAHNELALLAAPGRLRLFSCARREAVAEFAAGEVLDAAFLPKQRKAVWAEGDGRLVFADTLFGEVQFVYQLQRPVVSLAVEEDLRLLCTVFAGAREIALWHVVDVNRRAGEPLAVEFASPVRRLPSDLRAQFLGAAAPAAQRAEAGPDPLVAALDAFEAAQPPGEAFSRRDAAHLRAVRFAGRRQPDELAAEAVIEPLALPFFLDFSARAAAAEQRPPAPAENALMSAHLAQPEALLAAVELADSAENAARFRALADRLEAMTAAETDFLLKRAAFFAGEDALRLLLFLTFLCEQGLKLDLANCLLASFLPAAWELLRQQPHAGPGLAACLARILRALHQRCGGLAAKALQLQAVCESIARGAA